MAKNSVGQFIAALRKANGMTQQDVADRLNVSNKAVSRWERDECSPDISVIPALAEMFGVTCDELLKGERNRDHDTLKKNEQKTDKQVKNLINRTLSRFKTLIWISLTVATVGLICMFGIADGYGKGFMDIGFAIMLLFEVCAIGIAVLAVSRTKDVRNDNELFEMADNAQIEEFNNVLGSFSFWAFFAVISSIIMSLPFILPGVYGPDTPTSLNAYFDWFFSGILMILLLIYIIGKQPYMSWIVNGKISLKIEGRLTTQNDRRSFIQITLTVMAGLLFLIGQSDLAKSDFLYFLSTVVAFILLIANIMIFVIFMKRNRDERSKYLLSEIRNICLLPAALMCFFSGRNDVFIVIDYFIVVFIVFSHIETFMKRKGKKKNASEKDCE